MSASRSRRPGKRSRTRSVCARDMRVVAPGQPRAHPQVLGHGELGEHAVPGGHVHETARGDAVRREAADVGAVEDDRAALRCEEARGRAQHRRLPGTVRAEQRDGLARAHRDAHAEEHLHVPVRHVDVAQAQHEGLGRSELSARGTRRRAVARTRAGTTARTGERAPRSVTSAGTTIDRRRATQRR